MVQDETVHQFYREQIDERTKSVSNYEKIKYFTLFAREFSQGEDEVTATLKIKRRKVMLHYKDAIERMYRETSSHEREGRNRIFFVT